MQRSAWRALRGGDARESPVQLEHEALAPARERRRQRRDVAARRQQRERRPARAVSARKVTQPTPSTAKAPNSTIAGTSERHSAPKPISVVAGGDRHRQRLVRERARGDLAGVAGLGALLVEAAPACGCRRPMPIAISSGPSIDDRIVSGRPSSAIAAKVQSTATSTLRDRQHDAAARTGAEREHERDREHRERNQHGEVAHHAAVDARLRVRAARDVEAAPRPGRVGAEDRGDALVETRRDELAVAHLAEAHRRCRPRVRPRRPGCGAAADSPIARARSAASSAASSGTSSIKAADVDPVFLGHVAERHRVGETLHAAHAGQLRDLAMCALQQQQVVALEDVALGLERDHEDLVVAELADRRS